MGKTLAELIREEAPLVMGIINCTPDSFYEGSRKQVVEDALAAARMMIREGAHILDIGGESSRPGSAYVSAEEELRRVVPVIKAIRSESDILISIDTRKAVVARAAVTAGADIVNDISALADDPELGAFAAEQKLPVILMHMKGTPETMQNDPFYEDAVAAVKKSLSEAVERALSAGIDRENIILDPGIGFGKRPEDNLDLIKGIQELKKSGFPLLIGLSRKRFIGHITGRDAADRMAGTLSANLFSAMEGADILRVHDVPETVDALKMLKALL
ncbi:dihydropteroate synthase [Spirochaeta isovalerica]|uniref:Dihydropteroate synthase n=1 Tax=Spirochaeta isovalerica TaxID=150 RepID=A0A841RDV6_9SPIO|nr:dihydropteroate synthase [Spirochaeta isovalerica]MBB6480808.1 dihydropteroate synthase [Spirochaeta isovalerica]